MKLDHRLIIFDLVREYVQNSDLFRNIRKTCWDLYKKELDSQLEYVDLNNENFDELMGSMNETKQ